MNSIIKIDIAKDFSPVPLGRFPDDSPHNGTTFREQLLLPALKKASHVQVIFDGAEGFGSSFLEEAFGGLIRQEGWREADLLRQLDLISAEDPTLIDEIFTYLHEAETLLYGNVDSENRPKGR